MGEKKKKLPNEGKQTNAKEVDGKGKYKDLNKE